MKKLHRIELRDLRKELLRVAQSRREGKERLVLPTTTEKRLDRLERDITAKMIKEGTYIEPEKRKLSISKESLPKSFVERAREKLFGEKARQEYKVIKKKPFEERLVSEPDTIRKEPETVYERPKRINELPESMGVIVPKKERGTKVEVIRGVQNYYSTEEAPKMEATVREAVLKGVRERMVEEESKEMRDKEEKMRKEMEKEDKERMMREKQEREAIEKEDLRKSIEDKVQRIKERKEERAAKRDDKKAARKEKAEEKEMTDEEKEYQSSAQKLIDEA
jgi:hypothetical protein